MEQKHKPSYFKYSDSRSMTTETASISSSNKAVSKIDSISKDSSDYVEEPKNKKTGGFRGFFIHLTSRSGSKSKSNKKRKNQIESNNDEPLSEDDVRNLIALYSKYENLYNPKNSQYGNKQIESIYYSDMARSFPNKSGAQLQSYLHELRASFEREHTIIENERLRSKQILHPSIKYYTEFLFLVPYLNLNESQRSKKSVTCAASTVSIASKNVRTTAGKSPQPIVQSLKAPFVSDSIIMQGNPMFGCLSKKKKPSKTAQSDNEEQEEPPKKDIPKKTESKSILKQKYPKKLEAEEEKSNEQTLKLKLDAQSEQQDGQKENSQAEPVKETTKAEAETNALSATKPNGQRQLHEDNTVLSVSENLTAANNTSDNYKCQAVCSQFAIYKRVSQEPGRGEYAEDQRCASAASSRKQHQPNCRRSLQHRSPSPNNLGENSQQVQMLCDMIKAELSCAPDFIYYDAKWRIIEILHEVNKRLMIHKKGEPAQTASHPNDSAAMSQRTTAARLGCQAKLNCCPYCLNGSKR